MANEELDAHVDVLVRSFLRRRRGGLRVGHIWRTEERRKNVPAGLAHFLSCGYGLGAIDFTPPELPAACRSIVRTMKPCASD